MRKQVTFVSPTHHFNQSLVVRKLFRVAWDFCWQTRVLAAKRWPFRRRIKAEKVRSSLEANSGHCKVTSVGYRRGAGRLLSFPTTHKAFPRLPLQVPVAKSARSGPAVRAKSRSGWIRKRNSHYRFNLLDISFGVSIMHPSGILVQTAPAQRIRA